MRRGRRLVAIAGALVIGFAGLLWLRRDSTARTLRANDEGDRAAAPSFRPNQLELEPAALSGTVLGDRKPVPDALVCAGCVSCEATSAKPSRCTRSDRAGHYAFGELAPGAYIVSAAADGFQPAAALEGSPVLLEAGAARSGIDVTLAPGGARLLGTVVDATGGPVPRAKVRAVRLEPPRISLDREADDAGNFEFALRPGFILLVAEADGYAPARVNAVAPRSDVQLVLTPGAAIRGTVRSAADDSAVAGVEVRALALRNRSSAVFRSGVSDEDGTFAIDGLQPDGYQLLAKGGRWYGETTGAIELELAEQRKDVVVRVRPAAEVSGRVLDRSTGEPCRQGFATLGEPDALAPTPVDAPGPARSGLIGPEQFADIQADGTVRFEGVPAADYYVTIKCQDRLVREGPRFLQVRDASIAGLEWTVAEGSTLRVKLVDARGRAVPDTRFVLAWPRRSPDQAATVAVLHTDGDGEFALRSAPPGTYGVGPYDGTLRDPEVTVEVEDGEADATVTLGLRASGSISVETVTPAGTPLNDLYVSAREVLPAPVSAGTRPAPIPSQALGDGKFKLAPLPPGRYVVSAEDGIHPAAREGDTPGREVVVTEGGSTNVRLVLRRGGTIHGSVVDASGSPAPNVWVSAEHEAAQIGASSILVKALSGATNRALTDLDGRFSLERVAEDVRYTLRATDSRGGAVVQTGVAPASVVHLQLMAAGSIEGVVVDRAGQPISQFSLLARNHATATAVSATIADGHGRFAIPELAPGSIELSVSTTAGETGSQIIELGPGQRLRDLRIAIAKLEEVAATSDLVAAPDPPAPPPPPHR